MEELLILARVGEIARPAAPVDTREVVDEVVRALQGQLSRAEVTVGIG